MELVEDNGFEPAKELSRFAMGEQKGQLFGRCEQDMRRTLRLPCALMGGRVACAGFNREGQAHLGNGGFKIARNINGQRFKRGDVERVETAFFQRPRGERGEINQTGQKARERFTRTCWRNEQSGTALAGFIE